MIAAKLATTEVLHSAGVGAPGCVGVVPRTFFVLGLLRRWAKDIEETSGYAVTYPMIGDPKLNVHLAPEVALHAGYIEIAHLRELIQGF